MIDYFSIGYLTPQLIKIRSYFAIKARKKMFDLFSNVMQPTETCRVLDLGVTPDCSLPESNYFEQFYHYKHNITVASIEEASILEQLYQGIKFVRIISNLLPFEENQFDILFCSAVLEHVGNRHFQEIFIQEALRVSKKFFFTTPNRQFPLDFHTMLPVIHWLPQSVHQKILTKLGYDFWAKTENLNLLSPKSLLSLFPPCQSIHLQKYRLLGLPSNLIVYGEK
jgi:hypothetical protein